MKIIGTDIFSVRGDTIALTMFLKNRDGTSIELEDDDKVIFSCKRNIKDEEYVIQKIFENYPNGECRLLIQSEETSDLSFGVYYYDIQLTKKDNAGTDFITTLVKKSKLVLEEEVTSEVL